MTSQVQVRSVSDIGAAVELVRTCIREMPPGKAAQPCPLICEELLLIFLNEGFREITVRVRGRLLKCIEIRAAGEKLDIAESRFREMKEAAGGDMIGIQISGFLLDQYADYYSFRFRKGMNIYRISTKKREIMDLTGEIYAFYEDAGQKKEDHPTAVLRYIAGCHRGFFAFSVFILVIKHLGALMLPVFVSNIINLVTDTGVFFSSGVLINILLSIAALLVNLVCYWIDSRCYRRFTRAVEAGFRMALVQKMQVLSMHFHSETQSGVLLSKMISDVQFIQMLIYDRFIEILYLIEDVIFIVIVALATFPLMLVFYLLIAPLTVGLLKHFSGPLKDSRAGMRKKNELVSASIKEMLEMKGLTRAHGLEKTEYGNILTKVRSAQRAAVTYDRKTVSVNNVTYGGFQGLRLLSLSLAALLTAGGYINVGTLVLFQSIFDLIIGNVQRLLDALPLITQGYDSLASVSEVLCASDVSKNGTELLPEPVRGEIEFRDVSFRYGPDKPMVLGSVSFRVPPGGSAAFVGKSGEGKSTILNLIMGLYDVTEGEVLIDGMSINALEKAAYRQHIAVVPQSTVLFSGTLWDNLVYGLRYVSADKVMEVIRRVGLEDLVSSLPEGLFSQILENGGNLSGGQRQRISIARALLRDPKIILLDEATSALDSISERQVQSAVDAMMGSCTVIIVAHRIGTIKSVDKIYGINGGKLTEYNSIDQLTEELT